MSFVGTAYENLRKAIADLGSVRGGLLLIDREHSVANASAIRSAREAAGRARELLEKEAIRESRWTAVLKRLEYLPRAIIVEPFGPLEMGGSRTIELAVAKRDKESLERAATLICELARTIGPTSLVDELERIDGDSRA